MKHFFTLCIALLAYLTPLSAQPQRQDRAERREGFQEFQMQMIIKQLNIEESKQDDFKKIYTQYGEEMRSLQPRHIREKSEQKPTNEQVEQQILDSFDTADKLNALKREYYTEFKKILQPHQILRMYRIEGQISERLHSEVENRANPQSRR